MEKKRYTILFKNETKMTIQAEDIKVQTDASGKIQTIAILNSEPGFVYLDVDSIVYIANGWV